MTMCSDSETLRRELLMAWGRDGERRRHPFPGPDAETAVDLFISRWIASARHTDHAITAWIDTYRQTRRLTTRELPLAHLQHWRTDRETGNVRHETGRFFSIIGVGVRHRSDGREIEWDQPIIDQPEIGILGLLAKRIDGVLHFCLQAKEEPGNIGGMQLSPTVQATYSNYTRVHGGSLPPFLEHFLAPPPERVVFAKLQTEDGGRFLYKSNRNMVVRLDDRDPEELPAGFIWLTLRQIAALLRQDNLVHACTRSILACLLTDSALNGCFPGELATLSGARLWDSAMTLAPACRPREESPGTSLAETLQWLDDRRAATHILIKRIGLARLDEWFIDDVGALAHRDDRFFRIVGIEVSGDSREVPDWDQPILDNRESGIIGLLVRLRHGRREFLMQAKADAGNRPAVQLAPTVEFTPGNYQHNMKLPRPFLFEEFLGKGSFPVLWENRQAEEGARFFHEDHLHRILLLPEEKEIPLARDFRWLPEEQLRFFLHLGESVNTCARSILACLL